MKKIIFDIFVLTFVTLFCILGTWQLYRLDWKLKLISEITFGLNSTPLEYSSSIEKNFQRVTTSGKFIFEEQIFLYGLNDNGQPGYFVVTPFVTFKKENVLVNRGWISKNFKDDPNINKKITKNEKIIGLLKKINKPNIFKPDNDLKNNIWFSINLDEIKVLTGKQFKNFIIYLEDNKVKMPLPKKISVDLPNNHLKYAITWYAISISILLYYLYYRKKR